MRRLILPSLLFFSLLVDNASFAQLEWPSITAQTRPWTRWWWMGSAVDTGGLRANMRLYKAAGLGGLELTPIYGVKGYEDHFVDYLSPAWMNLFSFTLGEARRLGLGLDMSTGTGWPFGGGPLIDSTYACKELFYKAWTLKGGETLTDTVSYMQQALVHTDGFPKPSIDQLVQPIFANKNRQALALFQIRFPQFLPLQALMAYSDKGVVLDLTARVDGSGHLEWKAPPGGNWSLYGIFQGAHGKMVERAAPGAEGNVIDHFSSTALRKYLSRFDTAFTGHDLSGLRAFFNDSYEVDDARGQSDWTPGFFDLFIQYRGYDLRQHLPALFGKDSPENNGRVLCDFRETISDLLLDKFTRAWRAWAQRKGAIIRNQAHGSPANILDLYAASDIPETEGSEVLRYKFATSAAHVSGKRLASSESVTWLNEHFLSSLGDIKTALDNYLLGGVNHIFYHGTAWSPPGDAWPGWLFYASVHFTPNDPSWQNFSTLNQYVARCQSFLQQGSPDNDLLLYYPIYDSWSDPGREMLRHYDRMDPEFSGTGFKECAEWMQTQGYTFDYISDRQVRQTRPASLQPNIAGHPANPIETSGAANYHSLLLPACQYISNEAMAALIRLADSGCTILVYRHLPSGPPGWDSNGRRAATYKQLISALHFVPTTVDGIQRAAVGKGSFVMGDSLRALLNYVNVRQEGFVKDSLQFVRRHYSTGNYYFIVNRSARSYAGYVQLAARFANAAIFDPMSGRTGMANTRSTGSSGRELYLQLGPGESVILVTFGKVMPPGLPQYAYYRPTGPASPIDGEWRLEFVAGGPKLPPPVTVTQLGSWTKLGGEEVSDFSGTASYSISFQRPPGNASAWLLDLGKVDVTARVFLNGAPVATLIGPSYQVTIPNSALNKKNKLEVRVSNLMANRIAYMDRNGIVWKKFYNTNFPAHSRENRGANGLFDASRWAPLDSGLSGPVTITPLGRP